jgi:hypothetical protein
MWQSYGIRVAAERVLSLIFRHSLVAPSGIDPLT